MDTTGAFDLHVHAYPSLFPRLGDDLDLAEAYRRANFSGFVLKGHHESTSSRAYLLSRTFPELAIVGGVVLNRFVGGLNPAAVDACLRTGGRVVWMPSIDADGHAQAFGRTGGYDAQKSGLEGTSHGISIFNDHDVIRPEVYEIIDLIKEAGAILATSHLSTVEIKALIPLALNRGVEKVVITHPFFKVPALDLECLAELTAQGAYAEFAYNTISPMWRLAEIGQVQAAVDRLGAERCILVSDGGQRHNPSPPEGLRIFAQSLFELGVAENSIDRMIRRNPQALLAPDTPNTRAPHDLNRN
ncbi:MAG: DUF6282 family protein [Chloroflexota bacterium]